MNMKNVLVTLLLLIALISCQREEELKQSCRSVYIDKEGVMRWEGTEEEAIFWGVNYTVPFAHAYRELERRGVNHKEAIRRDVYHMTRLGFNAFRLHIWDVEITDSVGNLLENEHLDLLDYLVAEVEKRGISTILTLQTNFGNGYPERNINTGAYSYLYEKCDVHDNPKAQEAQRNYVTQFMRHINRYTGKQYGTDGNIVGYEINNEPCHGDTPESTYAYISSMIETIKNAGCTRPIFYNVSHNMGHQASYFAADINGGTYQWYPTGLVAGKQRKGNFLPVVDRYVIPFDTIQGFSEKAKIVYEFDPADIAYSHIYPAIARTFRTAGFSWVTQFSYDPIDIAESNTEYQTHYMNLVYTPSKAISLMIAGEVMRNVRRGETFGEYPADTTFSHCVVSYKCDLSVWNSGDKYINSNTTDVAPKEIKQLTQIAGVGSSPIVTYEGRGAYFLDKLEDGIWRLEIMPDAVVVADAYEKPSPDRRVVEILYHKWPMTITLPDIGMEYEVMELSDGKTDKAHDGQIEIEPGVYILKNNNKQEDTWHSGSKWGKITVGEYVKPRRYEPKVKVIHEACKQTVENISLDIECSVVGAVDSVVVCPGWVSFWGDNNPRIKMERERGYKYKVTLPKTWLRMGQYSYYIMAYSRGGVKTYPMGKNEEPLDWNSQVGAPFVTKVVSEDAPLKLIANATTDEGIEVYSLPEWCGIRDRVIHNMPKGVDIRRYTFTPRGGEYRYFVRKYVGDELRGVRNKLRKVKEMEVVFGGIEGTEDLNITMITDMGIAYTAKVKVDNSTKNVVIPLESFKQNEVALLPIAYPVFSSQYFSTSQEIAFDISDIEHVEISTTKIDRQVTIDLVGVELK